MGAPIDTLDGILGRDCDPHRSMVSISRAFGIEPGFRRGGWRVQKGRKATDRTRVDGFDPSPPSPTPYGCLLPPSRHRYLGPFHRDSRGKILRKAGGGIEEDGIHRGMSIAAKAHRKWEEDA